MNKIKKKVQKYIDLIFLMFIAIIYFLIGSYHIMLPGFYMEEAFLITPAAHIVNNNIYPHFLGERVLNSEPIFMMINAAVGPYSALVYLPSLMIFGISVYTIRFTKLFFGLSILVVFYFFMKSFRDRTTAMISTFLMATLPFYVFMYRQGYMDDGILPLYLIVLLWSLDRFIQTKDAKFMFLCGFISGIGVASKLNFIWIIAGLVVSIFLLKIRITLKKREWLKAFLFFLVPLTPLILYNALTLDKIYLPDYNTIGYIRNNLFETSHGGNNLNFLGNVVDRFKDLRYIFNTDQSRELIYSNFAYFIVLVFSIIFFAIGALLRKADKKTKIILVTLFVSFLLSTFTVSILRVEHLTLILPLCFIILGQFLKFILKFSKISFICILFLIFILNLLVMVEFYQVLEKKGTVHLIYDWRHPSDVIYEVSDYLIKNNITSTVGVGLGFEDNIDILTKGKSHAGRCDVENDFELCSNIKASNYFLVFNQERWITLLESSLKKNNRKILKKTIFYGREKNPEIFIYEVA